MPIYEYRCDQCGGGFELRRSMGQADAPAPCPRCGGQGRRLVSVFASGEGYKLRVPERGPFRGHDTEAEGRS